MLFHISRKIIFNFSLSLLCLRNPHFDMLRGKLKCITVSRNDRDIQSFFFTLMRNRSKKIIRFQSCLFNNFNIHRLQDFFDHRNLLTQFFCHRLSCSFIFLIHFMPESWCMHVKCHRQIFWFFLIQYFEHNIQETIYRIRVKSFRICQIRHAIKCPVQYAVSIDQYNLLSHLKLLLNLCSLHC